MRKKSFWEIWLDQYKRKQPVINNCVMCLISLLFIISDWMLGVFSFSELLLIPIIFFLIVLGKFRITRSQIKWITVPNAMILINTLFQIGTQNPIDLRIILISVIKLNFYMLVISSLYNFICIQEVKKKFLIWNNIAAMVVCLLAIYIMAAIYLEGAIPWRPLVTFTRTGGNVYMRDPLVVRAKSIFMEPAHLGYYLNTILAVNLFNKQNITIPPIFTLILIVIICATFSYTAIGIMLSTLFMHLIKKASQREFSINRWGLIIVIIIFGIFIFVFRESIYLTLVERTIRLIEGTESSGYERLVLSWQHLSKDNLWLGEGFMHSPTSWNNFAYFTTELGILALVSSIGFILFLAKKSIPFSIFFILMNFAKGGYLSPAYWFLLLMLLIYMNQEKRTSQR